MKSTKNGLVTPASRRFGISMPRPTYLINNFEIFKKKSRKYLMNGYKKYH